MKAHSKKEQKKSKPDPSQAKQMSMMGSLFSKLKRKG